LSGNQTQPTTANNVRTLLAVAEKVERSAKALDKQRAKRPCLAAVWLEFDVKARTELSSGQEVVHVGDVGLAVNIEAAEAVLDGQRTCGCVVNNLLQLFTLGSNVKPDQLGDLLNTLYFIGMSPHYPYAFIPVTFHEEIEEHRSPEVVATIHRLAKRPFSMMLTEHLDPCGADSVCVELDLGTLDQKCWGPTCTFLASALASMLTAKTRRGYYLSLILAQSLPLFLKCGCSAIESCFPDVFTAAVEYIYRYYGRRIVGNLGETLRFLMAEPEVREDVSRRILADSIRSHLDSIKRRPLGDLVEELAKRIVTGAPGTGRRPEKEELEKELVFGRAVQIVNRIHKEGLGKFRAVVTVATEQWGLLQRALLEELLDEGGKLAVLYTQAVLHNVALERLLARWLSNCSATPLRVEPEYYPVSSTDLFVTRKVIEKVVVDVDREAGNRDGVLVLSQGPASVALQLYAEARRRGLRAYLL